MTEPETLPRNIYQRMHAVMMDISYVQKTDKKVNDQYRFVTHDAVTAKVREALVAHGIVALTDVAQHTQDGNRTSADVAVTFVNIDQPDDRVTVRAFGYGIDPQDKGPGKAISYAVKYAYLKAFALETGDDPERDSINHEPPTKPKIGDLDNKILPKSIPANAPATDAFAELPEEAQTLVREWALEIISDVKAGNVGRANTFAAEKCKTHEDQLALWSQLPSDVRSKMKAAKRNGELASQP